MITLRPVTDLQTRRDALALQVHPAQRNFVASNAQSLEEAALCQAGGGCAFPFCIYAGEVPVGFVMIGFGTDEHWENPPAVAPNNYNIWRLMIDAGQQGKGYGKAALGAALDFIRTRPCGPAALCWLSYEPENQVAKALYASFGFAETGEFDEGEAIAVLQL